MIDDGAIGAHQQIDLIGGHKALIERSSIGGQRLVVEKDEFHLSSENTAFGVDLFDEHLCGELVDRAYARKRAC